MRLFDRFKRRQAEAAPTADEAKAARAKRLFEGWAGDYGYVLGRIPEAYSLPWAMRLPAVQKAVTRISNDVSTLPCVVEEMQAGEWQEVPAEDPEVRIVTDAWSRYETRERGLKMLVRAVLLKGMGVVLVERDGVQLAGLVTLDPADVSRHNVGGMVQYRIGFDPAFPEIEPGVIVPNGRLAAVDWAPPFDRVSVTPPLALGWQAIRAGLAATAFASGYYLRGGGARVLFQPPTLDEATSVADTGQEGKRLVEEENAARRKLGMVDGFIPRGWEVTVVPSDGERFLTQSRADAVLEVSRILGPPPPMLDSTLTNTFSNVGELKRTYVQSVLGDWAGTIGRELSRAIWPSGFRRVTLKVEESQFLTRLERYQAHALALNRKGWLSPNEVREMEGFQPVEGGDTLPDGPTAFQTMIEDATEPSDPAAEEAALAQAAALAEGA